MSDQPDHDSISDDLSTYSIDVDDQLSPQDTLIPGADPVEDGFQTPDRLHGSLAHGTTAEEQARDETLEQRIRQEVPEEGTAYGAPDNESGVDPEPMVGGDDPDAVPAERDFIGAPGEFAIADVEDPHAATVSTDAGDLDLDRGEAAEEAAMHTITESPRVDLDE